MRTYEIDMLDVRAADACLIRFREPIFDRDYVVLIDAGNYSDGNKISDFVKRQYGVSKIDLAICTHCDKDHFGGFIWLLEQMEQNGVGVVNIKKMVIIDPANYINPEDVKNRIKNSTFYKRARSVYDLDNKNLLDMLDLMPQIVVIDPLKQKLGFPYDSYFYILGPNEPYYRSKNLLFRNDLEASAQYSDMEDINIPNGEILSPSLDSALDDSSSHNQSSLIFTFMPDVNHKFLFMGDAGREAFNNVEPSKKKLMQNVFLLKVPHHGSKHNMDSTMINWMNPYYALISTEKVGHYLNMATVNALKKIQTFVCSTHLSGNIWYNEFSSCSEREGYGEPDFL